MMVVTLPEYSENKENNIMYQGESKIPKPAKTVHEAVSKGRRVKGMGRRHPHSSEYTRKGNPTSNGFAIQNGLNKISVFFSGKPLNKPAKPRVPFFNNPFKSMMNTILKGK